MSVEVPQRIPSSSIRHRKEFNSAIKDASETMEDWYNRLRALAEECEYGPHFDAFILDQFICGLDEMILEYLCEEQRDLSLSNIIRLTGNYERSKEQDDVKPVIQVKEETQASDAEHYDDFDNDNSTEIGEDLNDSKNTNGDDEINAMIPFMAETLIETQSIYELPKSFECYICHKAWKTVGHLTYHFTQNHTIGKTSKCHLCGKWIRDPSNMVRHLNFHLNSKPYNCDVCDSAFARSISLKTHLAKHSDPNVKKFNCPKCHNVFISKKHLKIHKQRHNEPTISLSEKLDEIVQKRKTVNKSKAGKATNHKCDICSTTFDDERNYDEHMKAHCVETEWLCHLCGRKLMNKRNLIHHYRVHTLEKPFKCNDCDRAFASKEKLKLHSKGHSNIRPYVCVVCNSGFIQKGHLEKHMNAHSVHLEFKCGQCSKQYTDEVKYNRHIRTHLGLKPYECSVCNRGFKTNNHRTEHERTHTGERPYECNICKKRFGQRSTLRGHLKWHEKPKIERPKKKKSKKSDNIIGISLAETSAPYFDRFAQM